MLEKGKKFKIEEYEKVKFVWIKMFFYKKNDIKRFFNIFLYVKNFYFIVRKFERFDVILVFLFYFFVWIVGYLLLKKFKCRFIVEVRDFWL